MNAQKPTILCVDDDKDNLDLLTFVFKSEGYEVTACDSLEECLSQIRQKHFSVIVLDNRFGNGTSIEVCKELRSYNHHTPIVFYSGEARQSEIDKALECGDSYLIKPMGFDKLTETVKNLIQENHTQPKTNYVSV
ncbi:MAG TPA: response regulator [Pyrinomonadaceae bacterium]|jgi:DNA-binding response OmpR family regulator